MATAAYPNPQAIFYQHYELSAATRLSAFSWPFS